MCIAVQLLVMAVAERHGHPVSRPPGVGCERHIGRGEHARLLVHSRRLRRRHRHTGGESAAGAQSDMHEQLSTTAVVRQQMAVVQPSTAAKATTKHTELTKTVQSDRRQESET